jgi:CheY-like chemotaxis protein
MARLLDDLLDVSRVAHGKIALNREPLDLVELARIVAEAHHASLEALGHRLSLSAPDTPLPVLGDPVRLEQVITNLLNNAGKYTPAGGQIELCLTHEGHQAVLGVIDNGIGMEPEMLRRIFEPFQQAQSSLDRSHGGLGLGLALVRALVELHEGTVAAQSDGRGRGSRFTVHLPLLAGVDAILPSPAKGDRQHHLRARAERHVAVVEDNLDSRETLTRLLQHFGFEVIAAGTGLEAIELIERRRPDVAIVDIGLPELDGYEVAQRIRTKIPPDEVRLVALTGYGQADDRRRALEAGFDAHLVKPVDLDKLLEVLGVSSKSTAEPRHDRQYREA